MKKILSVAILSGALHLASAGTTNIYVEDWGTTNGGSAVLANGTLNLVGWTGVAVSQTTGPYLGIYAASGPTDGGSGAPLPANTVFFTDLLPNQTSPGMFYTQNGSGAGSGGDSSFGAINPALYSNLTFSVEITGNTTDTNYFAVKAGASWYVSTTPLIPATAGGTVFTNATLVYTNPANVWDALTIGATSVTIGSVASPNLSAAITGIGIVELPTANGFNYNQLAITAYSPTEVTNKPVITPAITPQSSYVGGGASFLMSSSGTPPLTYIWETNGVPLATGGRYFGTTNNMLTITNLNANDALAAYSVVVTNIIGSATNSGLTLIVSNVPPNLLYAEDFPWVGPSGNLPIGPVGWVSAAPASTVVGIYQVGGGLGDVFSYSPVATTNAYYTTDTNDTGYSGLPFVDINPASYPAITFQAGFVAGNPEGETNGAITIYWAVQMADPIAGTNWYSSTQRVPIAPLGGLSPYINYQYGFNPVVTNWNNLTITSTNAVIGGQTLSALTGNITGAGLIVAHNDASGSDMNFQNFEIITNLAVGTPPSIGTDYPLSVGVASGGGASFGVSTISGSPPFTYGWTTNGVPVHDGGIVSGSATATLTIANLNGNDNNMQIVAFVTNSAGFDESDNLVNPATLTVTNPPIGLLYSEAFPFVGPVAVNYPISSIGWVEAAPNAPNALFQTAAFTSQGAVFAYLGTPGTTVYYTTTASDTNQSGLPFPNINLASYPSLNFSVDIAPNSATSSNVTAYLAVQLNGTNWYVATSALLGPNVASNSAYSTYTTAFNPAAANWNNLTVTSSGGLIGAAAASNLHGVMTGAGLMFVTVGNGGTFNFSNFLVTGTGIGGINVGPLTGGNMNLSWVGNPAVELQSSTNLSSSLNWQDVPDTYGLYSVPVSVTGPQKFFRLKTP